MGFVSCCNQRPQNPNFSRLTLQLIRENKERLLNDLSNLAEPIADKIDNVIEAIPGNIGGQIANAGGKTQLNNTLNSLGGFLSGQSVIDLISSLNGWKNMSLDARALADIFSRGVFIPFGNFSIGVNTGKTTTATTKPTTPTTPAPINTCPCGSNPCNCNNIPKQPCQCCSFPCTCNKSTQKPCQCGTFPCTCNKIPKEPCQCGTYPCTCKKPCQCGSNPCTCNKIVKEPSPPCENSEEIKLEAVGTLLSYLKKKVSANTCN